MGMCIWHTFPVGQLEIFKTDIPKSVSKDLRDLRDTMKILNKVTKINENAVYGEGKMVGREEFLFLSKSPNRYLTIQVTNMQQKIKAKEEIVSLLTLKI